MHGYRRPRSRWTRPRRWVSRAAQRADRILRRVRVCPDCEGAIVKCEVCKRVHCDDECRPIECIRAEERTEWEPMSQP